MSKQIDERVVEMRFDNRDFEKNVRTSMSTLDKLKSALKLDGVSKGLQNVSNSARKVDFSGMANGIETVNARFSAMQVIGMTALSNITSAAMRAGTNLVKSFTIDPLINGFKEYELQMNSIQTILANTKSKGTTMDDVTKALDELNEYADLTIYNFSEMTKNIGTFTAAGVDLDTSVGAIKGIANLGAMSSSTSAQVNSAMYQLSQALATGRVSLMDWNSVVNAGMGGEQFQNALKRTAENMGKDVDGLIEKYGSFRESLTMGGWLTADILNETLNQIGGAYDEAELRAKGYSEENIKAILDLAQTAEDAATEVKTFTQLMDTLKEAVGSGFATMWRNIFGDFEEAKVFFSGLHEMLEPIVTGPVDVINAVIEGAMGMGGESRWGEFTKELDKAGVSVESFQKKLTEVASGKDVDLNALIEEYGSLEKAIASGDISADMITQTLKELAASTGDATVNTAELNQMLSNYQKVVDEVWRGNYGNIDTGRIERLKEAGWEYAEVQRLVNMTVDGHRLTLEDLSAAQIVSLGYTQEQADALVALAKEAEAAGEPMNTLINDILSPKRSGRELFLEGLENVLMAILRPLQAVAGAFGEVFGLDAEGLYNLIDGFNKFSKAILISEEDAENLQRTFKGLFSVIHIMTSLFGNSFVVAIKALNAVLAPFGTNVLAITGFLGDGLYELDRWITSGNLVEAVINNIGEAFSFALGPLEGFVTWFSALPGVSDIISAFGKKIEEIKNYFSELLKMKPSDALKTLGRDIQKQFDKLKNLSWESIIAGFSGFGEKVREGFADVVEGIKEVGPDIIEGLQNGLMDGAESVFEFMREIGSKIIDVVKEILGIHSPSTVFFEIGKNIIDGLCNGIEYTSGRIAQTIAAIIEDIKTAVAGVDWGAVFTVGAGIGSFIVLYQFTDALQGFATAAKQVTAPAQSAAGVMNSVKTTIDGFNERVFGKDTTSKGFQNLAQGVLILSQSIAILAASVAVLSALDQGKMWGAIGAIAALAAIVTVMAIALNKFANGGSEFAALKLNSVILSIGASFVLMAAAARIVGGMDWEAFKKAGIGLAAFTAVIVGLIAATRLAGKRIDKAANFLREVSIAFLLLAVAARIMGGMTPEGLGAAATMLGVFTGVVVSLIAVTQYAGKKINKAASFLSKVGVAFLLLGVTARLLGGMSDTEMSAAKQMLASFTAVIAVLIFLTNFAEKSMDNVSDFLSKVGAAFLLLGITARLLGGMSDAEMIQAGKALIGLTAVIALLVGITHLAPQGQIAKISGTLLAMSLSIGIIAGIAVLLSYVKTENLVKGIAAVSALVALMGILTYATKYAGGNEHTKSAFIGMAIAIGVMAASVAVLSLLDPKGIVVATACMSALMGMFALVAKSSSNIGKSLSSIIAIGAIFALLAAALYILAGLPTESLLGSATALSMLLLSIAISCNLLSGVGRVSKSAMKAIAEITLIMGALAGILILLSSFQVQTSIENVAALSSLLLAMSAACVILGNVRSVSKSAQKAMTELTIIVAMLAGVLSLMSLLKVDVSLQTVLGLSTLLLAMAGVTAILSVIGPAADAASKGAIAMVKIVGIISAVIAAIILITGAIGQIEGSLDFINTAGQVLSAIGNALGSFVAGIGEGLTSTLPQIGSNLAGFAENMKPFFDMMSSVDPSIGSTLASLGAGLLAITGSGLLDALASFVTGESSFDTLGDTLEKVGTALNDFGTSIGDTNLAQVQLGAMAFKTVAEAMSQVPNSGGLLGELLGGKNYEEFGNGMASIGNGLAQFDSATANVVPETLQPKIQALQTLMSALSGVPNTGGLLQDLLGSPNYAGFGTGMQQIGNGLAQFDSVTANVTTESLQPKIEALKLLMETLSTVPNTGGLLQDLLGSPNYFGFGLGMAQIANGLKAFYDATTEIGDFGVLNTGIESLSKVISTLSTIPTTGGWLDALIGDGNIDYGGFADGLVNIGDALVDYSEKAVDIDTEAITSVNNAIRSLMNLLQSMGNNSESISGGAEAFGCLEDIGYTLNSYSGYLTSFDPEKVTSVNNAIQQLVDLINNMAGMDTSGVASFQSAITQLGQTNVNGVIDAFSSAASQLSSVGSNLMTSMAAGVTNNSGKLTDAVSKAVSSTLLKTTFAITKFKSVGENLVKGLAAGMESARGSVTSAMTTVLNSAANSARGYSLYNTGYNIALGLANGIRAGRSAAIGAATSMVKAAVAAAKAAADVQSPSRVFYQIGDYMAQGMNNALDDNGVKSYRAGRELATKAIEGVSRSIGLMSDLIDSGMEFNPTITPVLDLSEIRANAGAINGILNPTPLSLLGAVGGINRTMNARLQNGVNDDVVSAIDKLARNVNDLSRPSYNIGGITYDDGSAIAGAVGELIRATRIERRI